MVTRGRRGLEGEASPGLYRHVLRLAVKAWPGSVMRSNPECSEAWPSRIVMVTWCKQRPGEAGMVQLLQAWPRTAWCGSRVKAAPTEAQQARHHLGLAWQSSAEPGVVRQGVVTQSRLRLIEGGNEGSGKARSRSLR